MSEEGPKLYTNKPKKAQLKGKEVPSAGTPAATPAGSAAAAAAATYRMGSQSGGGPTPPPPPPKESFAKRYKFLWPMLLTVNLVVGAYLFMRTNKKDTGSEEENASKDKFSPSTASTGGPLTEKPLPPPTTAETVRPREPIPENQQRDLFKWMLEEKRKLKPKDAEEKKQIDDEKALLKQLIRAKSIPTI